MHSSAPTREGFSDVCADRRVGVGWLSNRRRAVDDTKTPSPPPPSSTRKPWSLDRDRLLEDARRASRVNPKIAPGRRHRGRKSRSKYIDVVAILDSMR